MRFLLFTLLSACQPSQIDGTVVDASGNAVEGVSISLEGTAFVATTGRDGKFKLDFAPGDLVLKIHHPNFFERIHTVQLTETAPYSMKPTVLVKKPAGDGLFILQDRALLALDPGTLMRSTQRIGPAKKRRFCLDKEKSKPNALPAGIARFADKNAQPWRLFKLDSDGCAYRDARDAKGRWNVEYRERPSLFQQTGEDGIALHDVELGKGEYFIADWAGFFVAEADNDGRYTGRWIRVEG